MQSMKAVAIGLIAFVITLPLGCNRQQAPDVSSDIRHALDQAGLKDVRVSQDRVKAVVSLTGDVATDAVLRWPLPRRREPPDGAGTR